MLLLPGANASATDANHRQQALVFRLKNVLRQRLLRAVNLQDNAMGGATVGHVWHNNPIVRLDDVEPPDLATGFETVVDNVGASILRVDLAERQSQSTPGIGAQACHDHILGAVLEDHARWKKLAHHRVGDLGSFGKAVATP